MIRRMWEKAVKIGGRQMTIVSISLLAGLIMVWIAILCDAIISNALGDSIRYADMLEGLSIVGGMILVYIALFAAIYVLLFYLERFLDKLFRDS